MKDVEQKKQDDLRFSGSVVFVSASVANLHLHLWSSVGLLLAFKKVGSRGK